MDTNLIGYDEPIGPVGIWGVWDDRAKCWYGQVGKPTPNLYMDTVIKGQKISGQLLAQAAALVLNEMVYGPGSFAIRARLMDANKLRLRDTITTKIDGEEAIKRLEGAAK